jgi:hypothetical protein
MGGCCSKRIESAFDVDLSKQDLKEIPQSIFNRRNIRTLILAKNALNMIDDNIGKRFSNISKTGTTKTSGYFRKCNRHISPQITIIS